MNLAYAESLGLGLFCPTTTCLVVLSVWEPDECIWIDEDGNQEFGPFVCQECGQRTEAPTKEQVLLWIQEESGGKTDSQVD